MRHENSIARNRLNFLWEKIADQEDIALSDNVVSDEDLKRYNITRQAHDFEDLDDESSNLAQDPPILFVPLPLEKLRAHPLESESAQNKKFRDYAPDGSIWWKPRDCAYRVATYLAECILRFRPSLAGKNRCSDLLAEQKLDTVWLPSTFFFGWGLDGADWQTLTVICPEQVDGQDVHANITLQTVHSFNGKEDSIHFHELVVIISAMRNRARQFKVDDMDMDDEDEMQELEDTITEGEWNRFDRLFPKEARFPVLMTSFFGPQHARVFYACMDGQRLVIRQSKIYSFKNFKTAPIELFIRLLSSRPLAEPLHSLP